MLARKMTMRNLSFLLPLVLLVSLAVATSAKEVRKGDIVEFQWGEEMLRAPVNAVFRDKAIVTFEVNGRRELTRVDFDRLSVIEDPNQKRGELPIKIGDTVQEGELRGKVKKLEGRWATVTIQDEEFGPDDMEMEISRIKKIEVEEEEEPNPIEETASVSPTSSGGVHRIREWVDSTGKHRVEATFVALSDGKVTLRRASNDKIFEMPLSRLSTRDRAHVASFEVRFVEFEPPEGMALISAAVSRRESAAALCYGKGFHPPVTKIVILDLTGQKEPRTIGIGDFEGGLDDGMCTAISDDGQFMLVEHTIQESFDPETKKATASHWWSVLNCAGTETKLLRKFKKSPPMAFSEEATWINSDHLFIGDAGGDVRLLRVQEDTVNFVYSKKVGDPRSHQVFGISPNCRFFAVENGTKDRVEVYTIKDVKLVAKVPINTMLEEFCTTNSALLGVASFGKCVAWNLKEKKLAGSGEVDRGIGGINFGSPSNFVRPLSGTDGLVISRFFNRYQSKAVMDFATGKMHYIAAPEMFAVGKDRRIWYVTPESGKQQFRSWSIPLELTGGVRAPGEWKIDLLGGP